MPYRGVIFAMILPSWSVIPAGQLRVEHYGITFITLWFNYSRHVDNISGGIHNVPQPTKPEFPQLMCVDVGLSVWNRSGGYLCSVR